MNKNITRTIIKSNYLVSFVDMDTLQIKQTNISIFDLIDKSNIEKALKEELNAICANCTYLKSELTNTEKFKCSMDINFYIEHSEHLKIE